MNILKGKVKEVVVNGELSIVRVSVGEIVLSSILIDTPESAPYLSVGNEITVIFKETEVIIGIGDTSGISLRNKFVGTVSRIESDTLLSKLTVDTQQGAITSIITSNAVKELNIGIGSQVTAMIKTNELILSQ